MRKLALVLIGATALTIAGLVLGDDGDDDDEEHRGRGWVERMRLDVAPVENGLYREECGSCHMAYQPGLLPARSWARMMDTLDDHFGDNAELDHGTQQTIRDYLTANAADRSDFKRSTKIARSLGKAETPLRITEIPYFIHKHREVPDRLVSQNPDVGSFSQCQVCHQRADKGIYDDDSVRIPGYGRWDD